MAQISAWENEYRKPQLVSKQDGPQSDVREFLRFLRKERGIELEGLAVLDLGCGTGRNANYLAELGNRVTGYDISKTALELAADRAKASGIPADYKLRSIGEALPLGDASIDLVLDVTSSNSLNESERKTYLEETARVLKPGGYFFVRALCKDGDQNAKNLIRLSPGKEYDTYVNKDMDLTERVFSEKDFRETYGKLFEILNLEKTTNYARFRNQSYKRNYWVAFMQKKQA